MCDGVSKRHKKCRLMQKVDTWNNSFACCMFDYILLLLLHRARVSAMSTDITMVGIDTFDSPGSGSALVIHLEEEYGVAGVDSRSRASGEWGRILEERIQQPIS